MNPYQCPQIEVKSNCYFLFRIGQGFVMLLGSSGVGNKLRGFSETIKNGPVGRRICRKYRGKDR